MNWIKLVMASAIASILITSVPVALYAQSTSQMQQSPEASTAVVYEIKEADSADLKATESPSLVFSEGGIAAEGDESSYSISGTILSIEANGTYTVSGECSEGSIVVGKGLTDVTIIMDNLTLRSSTTAPVVIKKGSAVKLVVSGTNVLTDAEDPADENVNNDFEGAAIKVKSGSVLDISGTGKLTVDGSSCKNGIKGAATASITVDGATLMIAAANTALASDGRLVINDGTISINSGDDGIKSELDEDDTESEGVVEINGGTITVTAEGDGIEATNDIIVNGGVLAIESGDDAIHSDNDAHILQGDIEIIAGDDAIHAEYELTIGASGADGPIITVKNCYEGLEGAEVNLLSGTGTVKASDDGINAANKDLGNNNSFAININGGEWVVDAGGDGIDSNRNVTITGGKTEVFGSTNAGNSALDYDGSCTLSGGSILAVGMSGMGQGVSSNNCLTFSGVSVNSGTMIEIKDASGNTVYTAMGKKQANQVVFASDKLTAGATYTLYLNGSAFSTAKVTTGQNGMMPGQNGQMPDQNGQMPGQNGQMPRQGGQNGQVPGQGGQNGQVPGQDGQNGQMPGQNGQRPGQGGSNDQTTTPSSSQEDTLTDFVERLYQNVLGRQSDASGLASWIKALKNGASASQVVRGFFNSQELRNKNLTNSDYLKTLYATLFNREPDAEGYAAWMHYLDEGLDRSKILSGFCGSQEFANLCESFGVQK